MTSKRLKQVSLAKSVRKDLHQHKIWRAQFAPHIFPQISPVRASLCHSSRWYLIATHAQGVKPADQTYLAYWRAAGRSRQRTPYNSCYRPRHTVGKGPTRCTLEKSVTNALNCVNFVMAHGAPPGGRAVPAESRPASPVARPKRMKSDQQKLRRPVARGGGHGPVSRSFHRARSHRGRSPR